MPSGRRSGFLATAFATLVLISVCSASPALADGSPGPVFSWGLGAYGELGNGTNSDSTVPVSVLTSGALAGKVITSIAGGSDAACAVTDDGSAYCWGAGHLGNGTAGASNVPVAVDMSGVLLGERIKQISINGSATCALTEDSVVACWGDNTYAGSLGDNNAEPSSLVPVRVTSTGALAGRTISALSVGGFASTCAILDNGTAACWGAGNRGTLGNGVAGNSAVPVLVDMSGVLSGKHISAISVGALHMCATTIEGIAACWGYNDKGQVGSGAVGTDVLSPALVDTSGPLAGQSVSQVAASGASSCALTASGFVSCWGEGTFGALGAGNFADSLVPQAVDTSSVLSGLRVSMLVMGGYAHTCVVTTTNLMSCWGTNDSGELGNGTVGPANTPTAVVQSGVMAGRVITAIASGENSTYALTAPPEDASQFPTAPMQAYGRTHDGTCQDNAPDWVNWPGLTGQQFNSWGDSWQQWPNDGTGGFVCERQPYYIGYGWSTR